MPANILVVDDDELILRMLDKALRKTRLPDLYYHRPPAGAADAR